MSESKCQICGSGKYVSREPRFAQIDVCGKCWELLNRVFNKGIERAEFYYRSHVPEPKATELHKEILGEITSFEYCHNKFVNAEISAEKSTEESSEPEPSDCSTCAHSNYTTYDKCFQYKIMTGKEREAVRQYKCAQYCARGYLCHVCENCTQYGEEIDPYNYHCKAEPKLTPPEMDAARNGQLCRGFVLIPASERNKRWGRE